MRKIEVSHEVPLQFLNQSRSFNDFDYALVHLFDQYPQYKSFYKESIKMGRRVLLDNSAFELGESVCEDILIKGMEDIRPTYVIAPDRVGDFEETCKRTAKFMQRIKGFPVEVIGVLQGKTKDEYLDCYKIHVNSGIKHIAIPFDVGCYPNLKSQVKTKALYYAYSRCSLLFDLHIEGVVKRELRHHLLGCGDPLEYRFYHNQEIFSWVTSTDTSCPVILGMFNEELKPGGGLNKEKRPEKLADNLEMNLTSDQIQMILKNVGVFREGYLEGGFSDGN